MLENESIDEIFTQFTKITNGLSSLGDTINNEQKIRKVNRALPKAWKVKAITLKELNDREEMDFSGFIGNLKTHEMKMKVGEERETPKKKVIAFKATPSTIDEEDSSEDGVEDFAMLIRKVGKMFYKKGRQSNFRRGRLQGRFEKKKEEMGPYFHYKKMGHLMRIAPHFKPLPPRTCIRRRRRW